MFVHRSNSLEELVDRLAEVIREPLPTLLEEETVLIQSAGMERYLSRELSRRAGVLANARFPFPRSFLREVLDRSLGEEPGATAFEREQMTWALFHDLAERVRDGGAPFEAVRKYLVDDLDNSRRLLLAERLANLFDQYVTYRPRMVLSWQSGDDNDFQAILWRGLIEKFGAVHFAARCQRFMEEIDDESLRAALPSRVTLMGGPGLPPLFLQMLARIGRVVPTHVFSFTVCREYFADAHPLTAGVGTDAYDPTEDMLPELGEGVHPLLVSLGKVGADYQHLLEMIGEYEDGRAGFRLSPATNVLSSLQRQLVEGRNVELAPPEVLAQLSQDESVTIDSCHSRLREVETLHDRLLGWFAADPSMRPEDVVVLAPNIEEYSPLISAVFSARSRASTQNQQPHIPFRIADRSEKHTNAAARGLLLGLSLLRGRFKASEVLDLLQLEPVRKRYGIEGTTLERLSRWVSEAGIRWGIDGEHRERYGLPHDEANTWRFGLRRLLLGFALPDDGQRLWQEIVPFDDVAARDLDLLGHLCDFCENLFSLRRQLDAAGPAGLTLADWGPFLDTLTDALLADEQDGAWDTGSVRAALYDLKSRFQSEVTVDAVPSAIPALRLGLTGMIHLLEQALDASRPSTDFLAGGVTFCALLPLRTIPFRAVCVLGLNQGQFPRADSHHHLDLIARSPKRGDRSLRSDDRYLFLEVLLAARERLSLSYVGRSVQDNTEKPPSVVLTELSLVIDRMVGAGGESTFLRPRVHPLQPFHPSYFSESGRDDGPRQQSFDRVAYEGALALASPSNDVTPFFEDDAVRPDTPFAELEASDSNAGGQVEVTLKSLISFWKDPSAAYLAARGVILNDEFDEVEDREPVIESPLTRFIIGDRVLKGLAEGNALRPEIALGRGDLPVGRGGPVLLHAVSDVALDILRCSEQYREKAALPPTFIGLEFPAKIPRHLADFAEEKHLERAGRLNDWPEQVALTGALDQIFGSVRVEMSYGQQTVGRLISLWIHHLAACSLADGASENIALEKSVLVTRGGPYEPENYRELALKAIPAPEARSLLSDLTILSLLGRVVPLRFFASASHDYFRALLETSTRHQRGGEGPQGDFPRARLGRGQEWLRPVAHDRT